jgi:hypothetical protein
MEAELKVVMEDVASPRYYDAGIALVWHLDALVRPTEALTVLHRLQKRFPAFAEPYWLGAQVQRRGGHEDLAQAALQRGLTYCPGDRRLRETLGRSSPAA